MRYKQYRFDPYLPQVQSSELKSMVRLWGGRSQMRKDECITTIRQGLNNPESVQAAVESLKLYEANALAIVKKMGGTIPSMALAAGIRATGVPLVKAARSSHDDAVTLVQPLIHCGLLMGGTGTYSGFGWDSSHGGTVFSDERLLIASGPVVCAPLSIPPTATPHASTFRRPPSVILDVVGILQAIDTLGGLRLTKAGTPRTSDLRRLMQAMNWKAEAIEIDGLAFPSPTLAWIAALKGAELLSVQSEVLGLSAPVDQFAKRSYAEQVDTVLYGFLVAHGWRELPGSSWYDSDTRSMAARLALTLVLASVSPTSDDFVAIDALDQALFDRIGEHFSLRYVPYRPYPYNKTSAEIHREEAEWRTKLRTSWLGLERSWLEIALSSWLYMLGIVEIGWQDGRPASVRLTELGRTVLHPQLAQHVDEQVRPHMAWMVQPNFDIQVFLDQITPVQLAFLERHAERVQAHQHTAEYRLTRDSVYRGLESGSSLDDLLAGLQGGTAMPVPQNVEVELRAWAGLREQIHVRRRARLVEYPDTQARKVALAQGIAGTPVGDRFVLLDGATFPTNAITTLLDYSDALPRCLSVAEDGMITLAKDPGDLLIRWQLERWAEPITDRTWRITAASTASRVKAGTRPTELFGWLKERLTHPLPPLLNVALQAWTGAKHTTALAQVTILRCQQPALLAAITQSDMLRPFILKTLAPDLLLVHTRNVAALWAKLQWAGIDVEDAL